MSSPSFAVDAQERVIEPELQALSTITALLADLPQASQRRIVNWISSRFQIVGIGNGSQSETNVRDPQPREFSDAATLFVAVNPTTGPEKALTAAFWLQEYLHQDEWDGFSINTELKHLGHGLRNITDALNALIGHRPQLVVQLRKSGKTKQARKRYKLTVEGLKKVRQMISGTSET